MVGDFTGSSESTEFSSTNIFPTTGTEASSPTLATINPTEPPTELSSDSPTTKSPTTSPTTSLTDYPSEGPSNSFAS